MLIKAQVLERSSRYPAPRGKLGIADKVGARPFAFFFAKGWGNLSGIGARKDRERWAYLWGRNEESETLSEKYRSDTELRGTKNALESFCPTM
jgi:hypothetical protein